MRNLSRVNLYDFLLRLMGCRASHLLPSLNSGPVTPLFALATTPTSTATHLFLCRRTLVNAFDLTFVLLYIFSGTRGLQQPFSAFFKNVSRPPDSILVQMWTLTNCKIQERTQVRSEGIQKREIGLGKLNSIRIFISSTWRSKQLAQNWRWHNWIYINQIQLSNNSIHATKAYK